MPSVREDFARLVPVSIARDFKIAALTKGAGEQLEALAALIPRVGIYYRLSALPEAVLDHLAVQFHLEGYEFAQNRARKLAFVSAFWDLHRLKGTPAGFRRYYSLCLGRPVFKAEPPHKSYVGPSLSPEEFEVFASQMPEIRVYPFRHQGLKRSFFVGDFPSGFPAQTDALLRIGDRVTLYDPLGHTEIPLHTFRLTREYVTRRAVSVVEVRLPGRAHGVFPGVLDFGKIAESEHPFLVDEGARKRLYTLRLVRPYQEEIERRLPLSLRPSLTPLDTYYEEMRVAGQAYGTFPANRYPEAFPDRGGSKLGAAFFVRQEAGERIYKRLRLFDPSRVQFPRHQAFTYLGAFRIGRIRPHEAEVAVESAGKAFPRAVFLRRPLCGFVLPSEAPARLATLRQVGLYASRLSDRVKLSITNRRLVRASAGVLVGTVRAGEYRLEVV